MSHTSQVPGKLCSTAHETLLSLLGVVKFSGGIFRDFFSLLENRPNTKTNLNKK